MDEDGKDISVTFLPPQSFSLVVVAEPTIIVLEQGEDTTPSGVIEISRKSISVLNDYSILQWLMIGGLLLGTLILYQSRKTTTDEEE